MQIAECEPADRTRRKEDEMTFWELSRGNSRRTFAVFASGSPTSPTVCSAHPVHKALLFPVLRLASHPVAHDRRLAFHPSHRPPRYEVRAQDLCRCSAFFCVLLSSQIAHRTTSTTNGGHFTLTTICSSASSRFDFAAHDHRTGALTCPATGADHRTIMVGPGRAGIHAHVGERARQDS